MYQYPVYASLSVSVCVCVHALMVYRCVPVRLYECVWEGKEERWSPSTHNKLEDP